MNDDFDEILNVSTAYIYIKIMNTSRIKLIWLPISLQCTVYTCNRSRFLLRLEITFIATETYLHVLHWFSKQVFTLAPRLGTTLIMPFMAMFPINFVKLVSATSGSVGADISGTATLVVCVCHTSISEQSSALGSTSALVTFSCLRNRSSSWPALYGIMTLLSRMRLVWKAKPAISTGNVLVSNQLSEKPTTFPSLTMGELTPCLPIRPTGNMETDLVDRISWNSLRSYELSSSAK